MGKERERREGRRDGEEGEELGGGRDEKEKEKQKNKKLKAHEGIRTLNLLLRRQTRYHCATKAMEANDLQLVS